MNNIPSVVTLIAGIILGCILGNWFVNQIEAIKKKNREKRNNGN